MQKFVFNLFIPFCLLIDQPASSDVKRNLSTAIQHYALDSIQNSIACSVRTLNSLCKATRKSSRLVTEMQMQSCSYQALLPSNGNHAPRGLKATWKIIPMVL